MSEVVARSARHAGGLYKATIRRVRRSEAAVAKEAHHLHEVEQLGESGETPYIVVLGMILFLVPIVLVIGGLSFAAYYLAT